MLNFVQTTRSEITELSKRNREGNQNEVVGRKDSGRNCVIAQSFQSELDMADHYPERILHFMVGTWKRDGGNNKV